MNTGLLHPSTYIRFLEDGVVGVVRGTARGVKTYTARVGVEYRARKLADAVADINEARERLDAMSASELHAFEAQQREVAERAAEIVNRRAAKRRAKS